MRNFEPIRFAKFHVMFPYRTPHSLGKLSGRSGLSGVCCVSWSVGHNGLQCFIKSGGFRFDNDTLRKNIAELGYKSSLIFLRCSTIYEDVRRAVNYYVDQQRPCTLLIKLIVYPTYRLSL